MTSFSTESQVWHFRNGVKYKGLNVTGCGVMKGVKHESGSVFCFKSKGVRAGLEW